MPKHVPQRTCLGCRQVEGKRALMRIVRTPEGRVLADPTGKKNGRGTYIHRERDCWREVLERRGRLEHALKLETPVSPEDYVALVELAETFPPRAAEENRMQASIEPDRRGAREERSNDV